MKACNATGASRATFYRDRLAGGETKSPKEKKARPTPRRALTAVERERIALILNSDEFADQAPPAVYATLLDRGIYLCSIRTMYRILKERNELKERRNQRRRQNYQKPELLASKPNQVWSWDITNLKGPERGVVFKLYVVIDIFSRYVVAWRVEHFEKDLLAEELIEIASQRQKIRKNQLAIHSDRGSLMTSTKVTDLYTKLGIEPSLTRPYVSNDNAYSESQFKTLKYGPSFPSRFGSIEDARQFCRRFFNWYNEEHYHSGLALLTPSTVHSGAIEDCVQKRQAVLAAAFNRHPERFVKGRSAVKRPPSEVWINRPATFEQTKPATPGDTEVMRSVR